MPSGPLCITLRELGGQAVGENAAAVDLWLLLLFCVIKSLVADPGVSCHLTSVKLRQANLLACKEGKISYSSQLLTLRFYLLNYFTGLLTLLAQVDIFI